jgi:hypothetical protein
LYGSGKIEWDPNDVNTGDLDAVLRRAQEELGLDKKGGGPDKPGSGGAAAA